MLVSKSDLPIHVLNAIKGVRKVTPDVLPLKVDSSGKRLCKWCMKPLPKRKRHWCSDHCVGQFIALKDTPKLIYDRDKKTCRICQVSLEDLKVWLAQMQESYKRAEFLKVKLDREQLELDKDIQSEKSIDKEEFGELQAKIVVLEGFGRKFPDLMRVDKIGIYKPRTLHAYEIDYVIPVNEGGTSTADNLRTLCVGCHRTITNEYHDRKKRFREKFMPKIILP